MPKTINDPQAVAWVNHFQISRVTVSLDGTPGCTIDVLRSFKDGDAAPVLIDIAQHELAGDAFVAAISELTTGLSLYDEVKTRLYAILQEAGVFPADAEDG